MDWRYSQAVILSYGYMGKSVKVAMLKYILFLLSGEAMESIGEEKAGILSELKENGAKSVFRQIGAAGRADATVDAAGLFAGGSYDAVANNGSCEGIGESRKSMLIVTDDPVAFARLYAAGFYVVVYYHEGNREQSFPGAAYGMEDLPAVEYDSYEKAFRRLAGIPWDILETERMKLRESIPEDVDEFYRIYREPSITFFMENLYAQREMEIEYIKAYIKQVYGFYGFGLWTVLDKESGRIIGRAGLNVREGYELPELGFVIDVGYQGQGYATEVCKGILDYAENVLEFEAVQAFADEKNLVSIHLLQKLGFHFAGEAVAERRYRLYIKRFAKQEYEGEKADDVFGGEVK